MRDVKTEAPKDIDGVMKGHEQSKKAAYSKVKANYEHILAFPFDRSTAATPASELKRIYSFLFWNKTKA